LDTSLSCAQPTHARKVFWKGLRETFFQKRFSSLFFSGEKKSETKEKPRGAFSAVSCWIPPAGVLTFYMLEKFFGRVKGNLFFKKGFPLNSGEKLFSKSFSPNNLPLTLLAGDEVIRKGEYPARQVWLSL
jgi:hypothetical protein